MCEKVSSISFNEVKNGQYIKLENDERTYCVIKRGQTFYLMPVDLSNVKQINMYSINQPKIKALFNGKNGDTIKIVSEEAKDNA